MSKSKKPSAPKKPAGFESDATALLKALDTRPDTDSASRQAEVAKYNRIFKLRDEAQPETSIDKIWRGF